METDQFDADKSLRNQARFQSLDEKRAEAYTEAMKRGDEFPPVIAHGKMGKLILADGNHRLQAAIRAKKPLGTYVITADPQTIVLITFEEGQTGRGRTNSGLPQNHGYAVDAPASSCTPHGCEPLTAVLVARALEEYTSTTARAYASDLRAWTQGCATGGLCPIHPSRHDVQLWIRQLQDVGLSAATICRRLSALSRLLLAAAEAGVLQGDPLQHVRRPRRHPILNRAGLTQAEVHALLEAARSHSSRAFALVALQALNGLRVSEALSVQVSDVTTALGHPVVHLVGKGGKPAVVPLSDVAASAVEAAAAGRVRGPLIATRTGRAMDRRAAARLLDRLGADADISSDRVHCHALRAGFVTHALQAGVPLHVVQDGARHADPRQTRAYDRACTALSDHATFAVTAAVGGTASARSSSRSTSSTLEASGCRNVLMAKMAKVRASTSAGF